MTDTIPNDAELAGGFARLPKMPDRNNSTFFDMNGVSPPVFHMAGGGRCVNIIRIVCLAGKLLG